MILSNLNFNCSNSLEIRNLHEQVKKAFCGQKFAVWINCSSDLKNFAKSWASASNFKSFSRSLEQFFLIVGQKNLGNKIPFQVVSQKLVTFQVRFLNLVHCVDVFFSLIGYRCLSKTRWLTKWFPLIKTASSKVL